MSKKHCHTHDEHKHDGHEHCCEGHGKHDHHEEHTHCGCGHEHGHDEHHEESHGCHCGHEHGHDGHHEEPHSCHCGHHEHHDHDDAHTGCGCSCGCGHDHDHHHGNERTETLCILSGAVLFVAGLILESVLPLLSLLCFVAAYLLLGLEILWSALKNIFRGHIFDENFLMSIATIGAFLLGQYEEGVGIMLFYRVGEWFEHRAVSRSRSQIMEALDLRPESVLLVQGEEAVTIPAKDAKVGDILLVRPGDRIPLDGTVTEGESRIDTSPVTGEPVPVKAVPGSVLTSGCLNTSGLIKIRADKVLEESFVSRILDSVENASASKPKIDRFITRFSKVYTPFVVFAALFTAIVPSLITGDWSKWIYSALTFLVISCPCALVLSVPLAYFSGIGAASKQKILFKGGAAMEALKNIGAVVMDKTGTITKGNFVLQEINPNPAVFLPEDGDAEQRTKELLSKELLSLAASCESGSTHPIAASIMQAAEERQISWESASSVEEIAGQGIKAVLSKGTLLCGNTKLMQEKGVDLIAYKAASYGTEVLLALNGNFAGSLVISDTIKEDAVSAINKLNRMSIETAMLTGDSVSGAKAIATQTGIINIHAGLLPQDKLTHLQAIREKSGSVMFVGDGINDAPVLAGADVGAAMGSGADAAIEAADVVFMTSNMEAIPTSIRIAKETAAIAMQNVVFALVIKAAVMVLGLTGFASMWFAVFADSGVAMLCVLNSIRILYKKRK